MDSYKLAPGPVIVKEITVANFEADTKKKLPYYVDENLQYAVCPRCDNPIQILGLYKKLKNTDKPFGKHVAKSIPDLAKYDQDAYNFCPLARPQQPNQETRRRNTAGIPAHLLILLKEQFDRIIYILRKDTDILFSKSLLKHMLTTFIKAEGYAYSWASVNNLPWAFDQSYFLNLINNLPPERAKREEWLLELVKEFL